MPRRLKLTRKRSYIPTNKEKKENRPNNNDKIDKD